MSLNDAGDARFDTTHHAHCLPCVAAGGNVQRSTRGRARCEQLLIDLPRDTHEKDTNATKNSTCVCQPLLDDESRYLALALSCLVLYCILLYRSLDIDEINHTSRGSSHHTVHFFFEPNLMVSFSTLLIERSCELSIRDARRSRTTARSESSILRSNHRPAIESSSSSTLLASSMMEHIDDDLEAM